MNALSRIYRGIVDHLTKALGALGTLLMSAALIDPAPIHLAATQYLDGKWATKIGLVLFVLVILRGWYTGHKNKTQQ